LRSWAEEGDEWKEGRVGDQREGGRGLGRRRAGQGVGRRRAAFRDCSKEGGVGGMRRRKEG